MKAEWYSDNRDLVKWGVLLHLADLFDAGTILHVAYFTSTSWDAKKLVIDGRAYPLPPVVIDHFRNIQNATRLESSARVVVMDEDCQRRREYLEAVLKTIKALAKRPAIVFLDPDTGLEPTRRFSSKHVRDDELRQIWDSLCPGDLLVFYQHAHRDRLWISKKKAQFERALGLKKGGSRLAQGTQIARDVVFFFSQRLASAETIQAPR